MRPPHIGVILNFDKTRNLIINHEGCMLHPYKDSVGKLTIGVGRNLDDVGISQDEAYFMLNNDINKALFSCQNGLPWFNSLDEVRQAVMIDMVFNLGFGGFLKFVMTIEHIKRDEYELAAETMLDSKWAGQVGIRAKELSEMMRTGQWPDGV